jgi:hypothetical protein
MIGTHERTWPSRHASRRLDVAIARRQTASVDLQELGRIGVLTSEKPGREVIYKHPALVEVLTA